MRFRLLLLTGFATLVFASTAGAATFCVSSGPVAPDCDGGHYFTIQSALTAADDLNGADTVRIDPAGVYEEDDLTTGVNGFPVTIESASSEPVSIQRENAGVNKKVLQAGQDVTIKNVDFFVKGPSSSNTGIASSGKLALEDVKVEVASDADSATGIRLDGAGSSDFSRVVVRGGQFGVQQGDGALNMERTVVTQSKNGFFMAPAGTSAAPVAHIWQSTFLGLTGATPATGVTVATGVNASATLYLRDSVIANYSTHGIDRSGHDSTHTANIHMNFVAVPNSEIAGNDGVNGTYFNATLMEAVPQFNPFELSEGTPRPLAGGNLVNVDPTTGLQTLDGENDTLDVDGNVGTVGDRDLGAYEIHPAPTIAPSVTPALNSASISALINDGGAAAHWRIEFGSAAGSYDRDIDGDLAASLSPQPVSFGVTGLQPGTTYHYRVTSDSVDGPGETGDRTFTTASSPVAAAVASALKLKPSKIKRKKKGKLSYSLDKPTTVVFTAASKKKSKKKPKATKLGTQQGKAGKNTFTLKTNNLKKGKYVVTATPAGGAGKSVTLTVR